MWSTYFGLHPGLHGLHPGLLRSPMLGDEAFLADVVDFLDKYAHDSLPATDRLDATLDLLLDSDLLHAETGTLPLESSTEPKSKTAQAAKRRLKYRNKVESEREMLQEQANVLSEQLDQLQRARKRVKFLLDDRTGAAVWRAVATRQKEGRLVAEEQRRRLRNAVESRAQSIDEAGEMVKRRLYRSKDGVNSEMVPRQSDVRLAPDDTVLFEEFLHDLDVIYEQTDTVFQACKAEENPAVSYRIGPERKRDGDVEFVDNLDVLLVPFSYEQTCSAMWQSMLHVYRQRDRYHYDGVADSENTVAVKLRMSASRESGEHVDMLVHFVMRRYLETDRMVFVWRALSEGEGTFSGVHSDETGWCVVRPNNLDEPLMRTVMQTFVRFIPMDTTNVPDEEVDGYQFTKLVVTSVEEDGSDIARMMDSLLL